MGLLDFFFGNVTEAETEDVTELIGEMLVDGEKIAHAYQVGLRDLILISTLRLILVDRTGLTGKRMHITSHPWRTVIAWTMTTSGNFDVDSELHLTIQNRPTPIMVKFPANTDLKAVVKSISTNALAK